MEYYFTNLDFPEIRRFLLRNHHLAAQNSCEVAITWPDIYNYIYTQMYIQQKHNSSSKSINGLLEELRLINYRDHLCLQHDVVDVEYPNLLVLFFGINLQDDDNCPWSTQKEATRSTQLWLLDSKLPQNSRASSPNVCSMLLSWSYDIHWVLPETPQQWRFIEVPYWRSDFKWWLLSYCYRVLAAQDVHWY